MSRSGRAEKRRNQGTGNRSRKDAPSPPGPRGRAGTDRPTDETNWGTTSRQDTIERPGGWKQLRHTLLIHEEVRSRLEKRRNSAARTRLALEKLAAQGTVEHDPPTGGRLLNRTAVGTERTGGLYLWWAPAEQAGLSERRRAEPAGRTIAVRALGTPEDCEIRRAGWSWSYRAATTRADLPGELEVTTWDERAFIESPKPVRALVGPPSSGKTTTLLRAVCERDGQRTLFLTASQQGRAEGAAWCDSLAPERAQVDVLDWDTFVGTLTGEPLVRRHPQDALDEVVGILKAVSDKRLGPWGTLRDGAFSEIRAHALGHIWPRAEADGWTDLRADLRSYVEYRTSLTGSPQERGAAKGLVAAIEALGPAGAKRCFPELEAAAKALQACQDDRLPAAWREYDRIVIDDTEELTFLEGRVVMALAHRIRERTGSLPFLLFANCPEAATRATGQQNGAMTALCALLHVVPATYRLKRRVGCALEIALFLHDTCTTLMALEDDGTNGLSSQRQMIRQDGAEATPTPEYDGGERTGTVMNVWAENDAEAIAGLQKLNGIPGVTITTVDGATPRWLAGRLDPPALSPSDLKGRRCDTLVVVDAAACVSELVSLGTEVDNHDIREPALSAIASSTVAALSRVTRRLVLIDTRREGASEDEGIDGLAHMGDAIEHTMDEVIEALDPAVDAEGRVERITARLDRGDGSEKADWRACLQANAACGWIDRPGGITTTDVRMEAAQAVYRSIGRHMYTGDLRDERLNQYVHLGVETAEIACSRGDRNDTLYWELQRGILTMLERGKRELEIDGMVNRLEKLGAIELDPPVAAVLVLTRVTQGAEAGWDEEPFWADGLLERFGDQNEALLMRLAAVTEESEHFTYENTRAWTQVLRIRNRTQGDDAAARLTERAADCRLVAAQLLVEEGAPAGRITELLETADRLLADLPADRERNTAVRRGSIAALQGALDEAERWFIKAGEGSMATFMWREGAEWKRAAATAEGRNLEKVLWLLAATKRLENRPPRMEASAAERAALLESMRRIANSMVTVKAHERD